MNKKTLLVSILSLGMLAGCAIDFYPHTSTVPSESVSSVAETSTGENSAGESGEVPPSTDSH